MLDSTPLLPTIVSQPSIPVTPSTSTFTTSLNSALLSSSLHNPQPSPSLHSDSSAIELASGSGNAESELLEKENHASVPAASVASATTLGMAGVTMAETTPPLTLVDPEKSNNRRRRRLQRRKQQLSAPESAPISQRFAPTPIPRRYTPIPRRYTPISRRYTLELRVLPRTVPQPPTRRITWNRMTGKRFTSASKWRREKRRRVSSLIIPKSSFSSRKSIVPRFLSLTSRERVKIADTYAWLLSFLLTSQCYRHIWDRGKHRLTH